MDTNQVMENSEEVVETAAEAIAEAGWTGTDVAAGFGAGVLVGVLLTKLVIAPICRKVGAAVRNHLPKKTEVEASGEDENPAEETEPEPDDEKKPEEK